MTSGGAIIHLTALATGTNNSARIGQKVRCKGIRFRVRAANASAGPGTLSYCRIIVYKDHENNGGQPVQSIEGYVESERYVVKSDKFYLLTPPGAGGSDTTLAFNFSKRWSGSQLGPEVAWDANTEDATIGGSWWANIIQSNVVAGSVVMRWAVEFFYKDS